MTRRCFHSLLPSLGLFSSTRRLLGDTNGRKSHRLANIQIGGGFVRKLCLVRGLFLVLLVISPPSSCAFREILGSFFDLLSVAQLVATFIFLVASDKSRVKWHTPQNQHRNRGPGKPVGIMVNPVVEFLCLKDQNGQKRYKIKVSAHCSVRTKKSMNIKVRKRSIP